MGYLFLGISLFAGLTKGYCGKKTSGCVRSYKDAMLANTVRMVLCILIGFVLIAAGGDMELIRPTAALLGTAALSGVTTSVFVVCWLISAKRGAYMMLDVFLMLGVLVPMLAGSTIFGEEIRLNQWIGIAILLTAVIIMCSYNNSIKEKMNITSLVLLIICGLSNGLTDLSQKLFIKQNLGVPATVFNFYTYIFSAAVLMIFFLIFNAKEGESGTDNFFVLKKIFGYILVMSVCLFANSLFKTMAAKYLTAAQLYPINQGASLILSSVMSATMFGEKLTAKAIIGLATAFLGLIVINVL